MYTVAAVAVGVGVAAAIAPVLANINRRLLTIL
jgi:hypothetical protein